MQAGHVRLGARFIEKHEACRIDPTESFPPFITKLRDILTPLLRGYEGFFLRVNFNSTKARCSVLRATRTPNFRRNSSNVASG